VSGPFDFGVLWVRRVPTSRLLALAFLASWIGIGCSSDPVPVPSPPPDAGVDAIDDASTEVASPFDACPGPTVGDLPCDVAQVLSICQNCHQMPPVRGAPFPFMTFEDTQGTYFGATRRWQRMAQVIEPDSPLQMPPPTATDVPQLTDQQRNTLRAWFRACTPPEPEGQGCDKGETD
jgi:hypothetical protein